MNAANPRIWMVLSAGVTLLSAASHADPTGGASSLQSGASDMITKQFGPFKLTAGPNNSGEFAVNLDGKGEKDAALNDIKLVEHEDKFWLPAFYNIGYSADGTWTGDAHTARNATASLKPGIDAGLFHGAYEAGTPASNCAPHAAQCGTYSVFPSYWLGMGTYADLQYRYGTVSQSGGLTAVNQFNVGGGVFAVIPRTPESSLMSIDSAPRVSATYYHPVDTTGGTLARKRSVAGVLD